MGEALVERRPLLRGVFVSFLGTCKGASFTVRKGILSRSSLSLELFTFPISPPHCTLGIKGRDPL